jgi:hypothetical protein
MVELPPHMRRVIAKGREYFYFQRNRGAVLEGPRIPLPRDLHSVAFWQAYRAALGNTGEPAGRTFNDLIAAYRIAPEFRAKAVATQRDYERYLKILAEAWGGNSWLAASGPRTRSSCVMPGLRRRSLPIC